jgi:hypothetical protein
MKKLIPIILFVSLNTFASSLPTNKVEFCTRFNDATLFPELSTDATNLMSFKNQGGLFNGGVCWWHSRFQRNAFYLTIFKPELAKPKTSEVKSLIKEIREGKSVVTIPGFLNFSEFTAAYTKEILAELESWQLYDGVVLGGWIDGLKGDSKVPPGILKAMMDKLYSYVEIEKRVAYQKLQIKGITSHAWLIVGMKVSADGYEIGLIDSNHATMSENYTYKNGDESFFEKAYGNFVPYLEFTREELRIQSVGKTFCGIKNIEESNRENWDHDYQMDLTEAKSHRK